MVLKEHMVKCVLKNMCGLGMNIIKYCAVVY
jgi:hypothetical protein